MIKENKGTAWWLHLVFAAVFLLFPASSQAYESIHTFNADITILQDGSFSVEETISYDFDVFNKHGIFRRIPLEHPQPASAWYKKRVIDVDVTSVQADRAAVPFSLSESGGELEVKIGDPDATITGIHEYKIFYTIRGGLSYYQNSAPELYWNVTGDSWEVPILNAKVTINDPDNLTINERACYRGNAESSLSCGLQAASSSDIVFAVTELTPGEGLTIAQALKIDRVPVEKIEVVPLGLYIVPLIVLLLGSAGYMAYRIKTLHKPNEAIIAQYEPYPGVLPMYTGVLLDGRLDARDITAGLLYLAEEGFLKIKKTERKVFFLFEVDDYEITLVRPHAEAPTHFHEAILSLLFDASKDENVVTLGELKTNQSKQRANQKALMKLRSAIADDVIERGFYEKVLDFKKGFVFIVGTILFGNVLAFVLGEALALILVILFFVVFGVFFIIYRRRTRVGYEALNHIKGFKDFLSVTDRDRFAFHNAPEKSPEQFLQFLPYAVALGVEDKWAEVFKDITIPNPEWYDGNSVGAFSATALSHDLGAFSTAFASSSGSSPSSGGGSAGGGAGGGGGGSW